MSQMLVLDDWMIFAADVRCRRVNQNDRQTTLYMQCPDLVGEDFKDKGVMIMADEKATIRRLT